MEERVVKISAAGNKYIWILQEVYLSSHGVSGPSYAESFSFLLEHEKQTEKSKGYKAHISVENKTSHPNQEQNSLL